MSPRPPSALRERRLLGGWSQDQLARQVGVSRQALNALERGHAQPSVETALALAAVLGTSVEALFGRSPACAAGPAHPRRPAGDPVAAGRGGGAGPWPCPGPELRRARRRTGRAPAPPADAARDRALAPHAPRRRLRSGAANARRPVRQRAVAQRRDREGRRAPRPPAGARRSASTPSPSATGGGCEERSSCTWPPGRSGSPSGGAIRGASRGGRPRSPGRPVRQPRARSVGPGAPRSAARRRRPATGDGAPATPTRFTATRPWRRPWPSAPRTSG